MAITIQDQPDIAYVYPAYAPIEYLVSSTNTAESGFKIICKVYYGATAQLVSTQQINIRPSSTQAILSIQDVVKSFVSSQYSLLENNDFLVLRLNEGFNVTFQEYYDGQLQGTEAISDFVYVYNASPTYIQFASNEWQNYQISSGSEQKLLLSNFNNNKVAAGSLSNFSNNDNWLKVKGDQKVQIQYVTRGATASYILELRTIGADFNVISTSQLTQSNLPSGYYSMNVGVQQIASPFWSPAPNFTNAKYYAINIKSSNATPFNSKQYLYEIDDCNTNYTPYEIHWLNRWGGFDSFVFDGKSTESSSVNKTFAKYSTDRINGTSLEYTTSAQRTRAFNTSINESYSLNSRLLTDFESDGLEDLISSPEVYWNSPDGFVNVNVQGTTYERKRSENGKVFSLALTMTIDNSDKRQW